MSQPMNRRQLMVRMVALAIGGVTLRGGARVLGAADGTSVDLIIGLTPTSRQRYGGLTITGEPTVRALLQAAAAQVGLGFQTQDFGPLGELITGLAGVTHGPGFWYFWVNGRLSQRGATLRELAPGDLVTWLYAPAAAEWLFVRGDSNGDGQLDVSDPVHTLLGLHTDRVQIACPDAADADDDGSLTISDPIFTLNHLFRHGPPPASPYPWPGLDRTPDRLGCR